MNPDTNAPTGYCIDSDDGLCETPIALQGGVQLVLVHKEPSDSLKRKVDAQVHSLTMKRKADEIPAMMERHAAPLITDVYVRTPDAPGRKLALQRKVNGTLVTVTTDREDWRELIPYDAKNALANSLFRTPDVERGN